MNTMWSLGTTTKQIFGSAVPSDWAVIFPDVETAERYMATEIHWPFVERPALVEVFNGGGIREYRAVVQDNYDPEPSEWWLYLCENKVWTGEGTK